MRFSSLKVVNLNPDISDEQIQDLLGEKFSQFLEARVTVLKQDSGRTAYVDFKTELDAKCALQANASITMFGHTSHAMPCFIRPPEAGTRPPSRPNDPEPGHGQINDGNADHSLSPETDHHETGDSDPRRQPSDRGGGRAGCRGARGLRGRGTNTRLRGFARGRGASAWNRGSAVVRGRGGNMYILASRPSNVGPKPPRGSQRPYLLTTPTHTEPPPRQKPCLLATPPDKEEQREETEEVDDPESTSGHPNCSLYIGSMDPIVQEIDLKRLFTNFGFVLGVEIKHRPKQTFAFVHFLTPDMAQLAREEMNGKLIGHTVPKLGYGHVAESRYLWVGGIGPWTSADMLKLEFSQFGTVENVEWPNNRDYAYIEFTSLQDASDALHVMNGCQHGDPPHRLRLCYASSLQMKSKLNYKDEFPTWPRPQRQKPWKTQKFIHRPPETHLPPRRRSRSRELHDWESGDQELPSRESHGRGGRGSRNRESHAQELRHSSTKDRWSTERRRSLERRRSPGRRSPVRRSPERRKRRSPSGGSDTRRPSHRHSDSRSKKKDRRRRPSPYTSSISEGSMSAISDTSLDRGSPVVKKKSRKRRKRNKSGAADGAAQSPGMKVLKNPSPLLPVPAAVKRDIDERTVVLRSEVPLGPQVNTLSTATAGRPPGYTPAPPPVNPAMGPSTALPPYVPHPGSYYPPPVRPVYPPPLHLPPPDLYLPANPVIPPPYPPPMLPPVASYQPDIATSTRQQQQQSVPVSQAEPLVAAVPSQTHSYMTAEKQQPPRDTQLPRDVHPPRDMHPPAATPVASVSKPVPGTGSSAASDSVAAKFPKVWSGALVLRNAAFVVDLHLVSGSVLLTNSLLGKNDEPGSEADCPVLRIAQRLRLDQPDKLDELSKRLKKAGRVGCSVLLATSAGAQVDDDANVVQQYPLSSLVSYLLQKHVAAVVSLPPTCVEATGVLHAFPPCHFATEFLQREAPGLPGNCPAADELLVVLCQN